MTKTFKLDLCTAVVSALLGMAAIAPAQVPYLSVWTAHNDNHRSGANLNEASLTPSNVNQCSFGLLFTAATDGDMYGQPLYLRGITLNGAIVNAVYVRSANNSVYGWTSTTVATNFAPGTAGDKWVWFTVTGKNASSSGYTSCIDYIEFTPN
jgi:hypothetical protein